MFNSIESMYAFGAALLKRPGATLTADAPQWRTYLQTGQQWAYNEIVTALATRGYSKAQIDAWDRGKEFEQSIGAFWALDLGGLLGNVDDRLWTKLDRRAELATVDVLIGGGLVTPGGSDQGAVGHGKLSAADDLFSLDPRDRRRGVPTEW